MPNEKPQVVVATESKESLIDEHKQIKAGSKE